MASSFHNIESLRPNPDINSFLSSLKGKTNHYKAPMVEFIIDEPVIKSVVTGLLHRQWVENCTDRESQAAYLDNLIEFWYRMGYDLLRYENSLNFPGLFRSTQNTATTSTGVRSWAEESTGVITSWNEFEQYHFPRIEDFDFFPFEYLNNHLPEGMGLALAHGGGIFERVSWIFSIEKLCYLLFDQPDLVEAVTQKVSELQTAFYRNLLDFDHLSVIFPGDDMGFRSSTIISPAELRKIFLPFHAVIADLSHQRDIPYFLHSCGNLKKIMPDLIDYVKIDGKHSFEDAILPIEKFQAEYGDQVAVLGGMDVHLLATGSQDQIRSRVRQIIETCSQKGRFAIGSGNSIPDYVPVENYLAMVDEALSFRSH